MYMYMCVCTTILKVIILVKCLHDVYNIQYVYVCGGGWVNLLTHVSECASQSK